LDEKTKTITFDTKSLEKFLSSITKNIGGLQKGPDYTAVTDWLAAAGGAVAIRDEGNMVISSVNDMNFIGDGVTITRRGKNVDIEISGLDGGNY